MAKKDYALNFRAQIGNVDEKSAKWAEAAFRKLIPDVSVDLGIKPSKVQDTISSVKLIRDEVGNLYRMITKFQGADGSIITKEQVGDTLRNIELIKGSFTSSQQSIKDQLASTAKEIKKVLDESSKNLGNKDVLSQLDVKAANLKEKFDQLAVQLKNISGTGSQFDNSEYTAGLQQDVDVAFSKNQAAREASDIKQIEQAWRKVAEIRTQIAKLDNETGQAFHSQQLETLKAMNAEYTQEFKSLTAGNEQYQKRAAILEEEFTQKENIIRLGAQEDEQRQRQFESLRQYKRNYQEINSLRIKEFRLQQQIETNSLYDTKENRASLTAYRERIGLLRSENEQIRENASSTHMATEYTEAQTRAENEYSVALAAANAEGKKSTSIIANIAYGFKDATARIINYTTVYRTLWGLIKVVQNSAKTIYDLDTVMTDIRMVTGATAEETYELQRQYSALAGELGSTTKEIASGAVEWLRQGKSIRETNELLRASTIMAKVGNIDAAKSTELLTSALNGYNLEASKAMSIVDKLSSVDLRAATSVEELAIALQRTANSANLAGVSMDDLLGWIATVSETTRRSASTVGESFKTLFARFQNVKAGVEFDEEGESLNDVEKVLNRFNIQLRDTNGEFRSMKAVLDETNAAWQTLTNVEQAQVATAAAGTRQREIFIALMENYDRAMELAAVSTESAGSATQKFEVYMDSLQAKINEFKSAWESLISSESFRDVMAGAVDVATQLLKIIQNIVENPVTRFIAKMALLNTALMLAGDHLKKMKNTWYESNNMIARAIDYIFKLIAAQKAYNAQQVLGSSGKAISAGASMLDIGNKELQDVKKAEDTVKSLTSTVGEFKKGSVLAEVSSKGLLNTIKRIAGLAPVKLVAIFGIPAAIIGILRLTGHLKTLGEQLEEYRKQKEEAFEKIGNNEAEIESLRAKTDSLTEADERRLKVLEAQNKALKEQATSAAKQEFQGTYGEDDKGEYGNKSVYDRAVRDLESLIELRKQLRAEEEKAIKTGEDNSDVIDKLNKDIAYLESELLTTTDAYKTLSEQADETNKDWELLYQTVNLNTDGMKSLADAVTGLADVALEANENLGSFTDVMNRLTESLETQDETLELLISAQKEYNENGYLTADTMSKLLALSPSLQKAIFNQKGEFVGTAEAANMLSRELAGVDAAQNLITENEAAINNLKIYREELLLTAESADRLTANMLGMQAAVSQLIIDAAGEQNRKLSSMIDNVNRARNSVGKIYSEGVKVSGGSKSSSSTKKEKTPAELAKEQYDADQSVFEHQLFLSKERQENDENYVTWLRKMMDRSHQYAENLRKLGEKENSEYIQAAQKDWWKYHDEMIQILDDIEQRKKEEYDNSIRNVEHQLFLGQKNGASIEEQKALLEQLQALAHAEANRLREMGVAENDALIQELQRAWWAWEEEKVKLDEEALEQIRENNQKIKDDTDRIWQLAHKIITQSIQEQINALQKQLDMMDEQAEKEQQLLKLEEARQKLAEAKNKTVRIYREGMGFVYEQDLTAVAEAQAELNSVEKEFADWQKKKDIENEISRLNELKEAWSGALDISGSVSDYNKALELAAKYQSENYEEMLKSADKFKEDYNELMQQLQTKIDFPEMPEKDTSSNNNNSSSSKPNKNESSGNKKPTYPSKENNNGSWGSATEHNSGTTSGGVLTYDPNLDYQAEINKALDAGKMAAAIRLNQERNNKIDALGLDPSLKRAYPTRGDGGWNAKYGYADGTLGTPTTQIAKVGERGMELAVLPKGTGVVPNNETKNLLAMANNPLDFMRNMYNADMLRSNVNSNTNSEVFNINGSINVTANNADEFVKSLKRRAIQNGTNRKAIV